MCSTPKPRVNARVSKKLDIMTTDVARRFAAVANAAEQRRAEAGKRAVAAGATRPASR